VQFTIQDIDPQASLAGTGIAPIETMMWLSLYPLSIGGKYDASRDRYQWRTGVQLPGRRWRSIRTTFGIAGSGVDFSRGEQLEFWTLIDMRTGRRGRNPTLVFDFGDVSENSVGLSPDSAIVTGNDTLFVGRHLEGFNRLDSERDPFSRAFAGVGDLGLAGGMVDRLVSAAWGCVSVALRDIALRGRSVCWATWNAPAAATGASTRGHRPGQRLTDAERELRACGATWWTRRPEVLRASASVAWWSA
jgi:hypothetical protein